MTKEEAIKVLKDLWRYEKSNYSDEWVRKALDMAIKSLNANPLIIECKRFLPDRDIESVRNQIKKQLEEGMNEVVILPSGFEVAKDRIVKCRECVHYEKSTNLCTKNRDKVFHEEEWFCADGIKEATKENS